jgi:hypothetical protein
MKTVRPWVLGLVVGAIAFACDRVPTAAPTPSLEAARVKSSSTTNRTGLVACHQTYDSASKVFGPKGDSLRVGNHIFWVDAQVLRDTVTITAVAPADTVRWVRFQPEGLLFPPNSYDVDWLHLSAGAILYTNFKDCGVPSSDTVRIAQVSDSLAILGYLQSWSKVKNVPWSQGLQYVAGQVPHFTNFAIAW